MDTDPSPAHDGPEDNATWLPFINSMKVAIAHFDVEGLNETYEEALSLYSVSQVTDQLLTPLLIELGQRWDLGESGIAEEHFFAFYIRNILGSRFHNLSSSSTNTGRRILLAGLPGEYHEIALLLFALTLESAGLPVLVLGANMPMEQVAIVANKQDCRAIVLAGVNEPAPGIMTEHLAGLVKAVKTLVFIGGPSSIIAREDIHRVGAESLGADFGQALERLKQLKA